MTSPMPRVKSIAAAADPFSVDVAWAGGGSDRIDMTGVVFRGEAFKDLRDEELFRRVGIITHGWGVGWPNGLDYSAENLERLAIEQRDMDGAAFAKWQAGLDLSNQQAADVLGVTDRTVKNYRSGRTPIPSAVQIACRALAENPTVLASHFRPRFVGRPPRKDDEKPQSRKRA